MLGYQFNFAVFGCRSMLEFIKRYVVPVSQCKIDIQGTDPSYPDCFMVRMYEQPYFQPMHTNQASVSSFYSGESQSPYSSMDLKGVKYVPQSSSLYGSISDGHTLISHVPTGSEVGPLPAPFAFQGKQKFKSVKGSTDFSPAPFVPQS